MEIQLTMKLFFILYCLFGVTNSRSVTQNNDDDDDQSNKAKEISSSISSLKLNKIPHRIYVAGNDIIEDFEKSLMMKNHVEMKFTYELVEPKLCEVFNPPFGCCWDNKTVALGPHSEGCPACKNKKKSCRKWKDQCHTQVIKENCPETCNICPNAKDTPCQDSPDQKAFCPYYARFGLCKREQIRDFCKGSCRVCENKLDDAQKVE